jgi:hypothetical protein
MTCCGSLAAANSAPGPAQRVDANDGGHQHDADLNRPMDSDEEQDLIQRVLHHPDFHVADVDHDLRERLMRAVEVGDIEVIDMWEEGDGPQDNTFVTRKMAMVLAEIISDQRMAGRQHFGFKLSTDANGERVLRGDAN